MMSHTDIRHVLPSIVAPTLVIVRTAVPVYDADHGRYVADHVPNATLLEQHDTNDPWFVGDTTFVNDAIDQFLAHLDPST